MLEYLKNFRVFRRGDVKSNVGINFSNSSRDDVSEGKIELIEGGISHQILSSHFPHDDSVLEKAGCILKYFPCVLTWSCRGHLIELISFAGWHILGIPSALQLPFLWYVFWKYACALGTIDLVYSDDVSVHHLFSIKVLVLWVVWAVVAFSYRRAFHTMAPSMIVDVVRYFEFFLLSALIVTLSANICSMLHTPAEPLFDLGFIIIPAQSMNSAWRPVSDILAQTLPVALILRSLCFHRPARCLLLVNWLRCVSLAYIFRALTVTLTSLPGPAPHCINEEGYNPPTGWHDIATRLGPMIGDYGTCGDLIFSGHTAFTTMTMLCLVKTFEGKRGYSLARILGPMYVCIMAILALAGRKHYSVDIAVAVLVSSLTFHRFQEGWVARRFLGKGLSDEQFFTTRKNTIDFPEDFEAVPQFRTTFSSRIQLV